MKRPVQALEIADNPEVLLSIMLEQKKISLREGHRDYIPGKLIIYNCDNNFSIQVEITSVKHSTLAEITEAEMKADGYQTKEEMLADLKQYYPDLTSESPMTVISWDNVEGFWSKWGNIVSFALMTNQEERLKAIE